ncbi:NEDD8 ultimate buster 1 [Drosophila takahashii]|uniref:NEDD8 ultimate buster 1 n=1 Tax=Drosophila takahashii TaxID=29030 RepID=UPI001CF800FA|nr:LOW QUALITY PROTEIN: NEDD8 ultimate buster 1 [Drosophila takahashii]
MSQINNTFIKLRSRLRERDIKLWEEPYYFEGVGSIETEMDRLARDLSGELGIDLADCRCALAEMQDGALRKLAARREFNATGLATFNVRCVDSKGGTSQILEIKCSLGGMGSELQGEVAKKLNLSDPSHVKCISGGRLINGQTTLASQGLKTNQQLMVIVGGENEGQQLHERIQRIRADVELITDADHRFMEMEDQDGRPIFLPPDENRSLLMAMSMYEASRGAMRRENFDEALLLLLEADELFSRCDSKFLEAVDNYALINLDIVWCYLCLKNITQLPDAQRRLDICERSFFKSYGEQFGRLYSLKGTSCPERALIMRLHLLQGVLFFHQNRRDEAYEKLEEASRDLNELRVDDDQLSALVEMGYEESDARLALRSCAGNVDRAIEFIQERKVKISEERRNSAPARQVYQEMRDANSGGGEWVDPRSVCRLMEMGYERRLVVEALKRTKNNLERSLDLLQRHSDDLRANLPATPAVDESLLSTLQQLGFPAPNARVALETTDNNFRKSIEFLLKSFVSEAELLGVIEKMTKLVEDLGPSGSKRGSSSSSSTTPLVNLSGSKMRLVKSVLSQAKSEIESYNAYKRFNEELSEINSHYLDLPLVQEEQILIEYRNLLER